MDRQRCIQKSATVAFRFRFEKALGAPCCAQHERRADSPLPPSTRDSAVKFNAKRVTIEIKPGCEVGRKGRRYGGGEKLRTSKGDAYFLIQRGRAREVENV